MTCSYLISTGKLPFVNMLDIRHLHGHNARPSRQEIYAETTYIERSAVGDAASMERAPGVVSPEIR